MRGFSSGRAIALCVYKKSFYRMVSYPFYLFIFFFFIRFFFFFSLPVFTRVALFLRVTTRAEKHALQYELQWGEMSRAACKKCRNFRGHL